MHLVKWEKEMLPTLQSLPLIVADDCVLDREKKLYREEPFRFSLLTGRHQQGVFFLFFFLVAIISSSQVLVGKVGHSLSLSFPSQRKRKGKSF
jgi:hypothetical protein